MVDNSILNGTQHQSMQAILARYSASQARAQERRAEAQERLDRMQRRQRRVLLALIVGWLLLALWVGYTLVH